MYIAGSYLTFLDGGIISNVMLVFLQHSFVVLGHHLRHSRHPSLQLPNQCRHGASLHLCLPRTDNPVNPRNLYNIFGGRFWIGAVFPKLFVTVSKYKLFLIEIIEYQLLTQLAPILSEVGAKVLCSVFKNTRVYR